VSGDWVKAESLGTGDESLCQKILRRRGREEERGGRNREYSGRVRGGHQWGTLVSLESLGQRGGA